MADIYEFSIVADAIAECLKIGENLALKKNGFDFTDPIWLPLKWQLQEQR